MMPSTDNVEMPMLLNMAVDIQFAACVLSRTVPKEIPAANKMMVPQGIFASASFQLKTPILGVSMMATARTRMAAELLNPERHS